MTEQSNKFGSLVDEREVGGLSKANGKRIRLFFLLLGHHVLSSHRFASTSSSHRHTGT
jgi:hypothetical protein